MRKWDWEDGLKVSRPIRIGLIMGLMGLLAAILWPIFTLFDERGHKATCTSNVKQLSLSLLMYSQDYDEHLPPAVNWMDTSLPYTKNINIYHCPEMHSPRPTDFGYAFNNLLSLKSLVAMKAPAARLMLYDSTDLRWNANSPGHVGIADPPRHHGGNYYGFADAHVKWFKLSPTEE